MFILGSEQALASNCSGFSGGGKGISISFCLDSFINPTSIEGLIVDILNVFIIIAIPIVVLYIIYSGFQYVTAGGNQEQIRKATTSLTYSIIGGVLIIGAVTLSKIIENIVKSFTT